MRNHSYENDFDLYENETAWFRTYTRFETEAQENSVGNGLTRLHFAADFLQKNKKINPRIILQMRRSLTKVFSEAVRNTRSMRFKSDKTLLF